MNADPPLLAILVALGAGGAFFSGLLGLGGAIVMIPLLFYVPPVLALGQLDMKVVTGITIVQVFFASLSGVLAHRRNRMVSRALVLYMGGTSLLASLIGAVASSFVEADVLTVVFASLALGAAALMFVPRRGQGEGPTAEGVTFNKPLATAIAAVVGVLAGMVGAGGAFVLIPAMLYFLRIPTRVAVGSTLGIVFLSSLAGLIGKLSTGQVSLPLAAALVAGAVPGAQVGGWASQRIQVRVLRLILSLVIAGAALRMWYDVLSR